MSELASQSCITSMRHNPKRPDIIAGGLYNGQLQWWDTREGQEPVAQIDRDNSHVQPVYSTIWVASKTESEIMTASPDGTVRVCRVYKKSEIPFQMSFSAGILGSSPKLWTLSFLTLIIRIQKVQA